MRQGIGFEDIIYNVHGSSIALAFWVSAFSYALGFWEGEVEFFLTTLMSLSFLLWVRMAFYGVKRRSTRWVVETPLYGNSKARFSERAMRAIYGQTIRWIMEQRDNRNGRAIRVGDGIGLAKVQDPVHIEQSSGSHMQASIRQHSQFGVLFGRRFIFDA